MFENAKTTLQQGSIGLARAIYEYQKLGYITCLPLVDAQDYDLVIERNGVFQSVQCRTTSLLKKSKSGKEYTGQYAVGLRSIKTNTKITVTKSRGIYDLLFVLCGNGFCYSIPSTKLPKTGMQVGGPKYESYRLV